MTLLRRTLVTTACALAFGVPALAQAQAINIAGLYELSGAGAPRRPISEASDGRQGNHRPAASWRRNRTAISDTRPPPGSPRPWHQPHTGPSPSSPGVPADHGQHWPRRARRCQTHRREAAAITNMETRISSAPASHGTAMPRCALHRQPPEGEDDRGDLRQQRLRQRLPRDAITKALTDAGVKVVADISTDSGQVDFSAPVLKAKGSNADALFVYTNEEESARALRELRKQGFNKPIVGETTLTGQKVIDLAGDAANGAVAHVGLTSTRRTSLMMSSGQVLQDYKTSRHNGSGYRGLCFKPRSRRRQGRAAVTRPCMACKCRRPSSRRDHGLSVEPGDRIASASVEVKVATEGRILPPLSKK